MDIDSLSIAVFISSAAGWYAGFYFERCKAIRALGAFRADTTEMLGAVANAAITLMHRKQPDLSADALALELTNESRKLGFDCEFFIE